MQPCPINPTKLKIPKQTHRGREKKKKEKKGKKRELTGADPISDARKPFGIGGGFGVDEEARLLASVAEGSEGVVSVSASAALPISLSAFAHVVAAGLPARDI